MSTTHRGDYQLVEQDLSLSFTSLPTGIVTCPPKFTAKSLSIYVTNPQILSPNHPKSEKLRHQFRGISRVRTVDLQRSMVRTRLWSKKPPASGKGGFLSHYQ